MTIVFFASVLLVAYSYALYPLVLALIPPRYRISPRQPAEWPTVTLIITAHNEQSRITEKLDNALQIDYPHDKLTILVASDCSSDDTDDIVRTYADRGVKLIRADRHLGKEYAQYCAIQKAEGEILVFSDVATSIPADALKILASYFTNPAVGAISSEDRFISEGGKIVGESAYVRYEMFLRALESQRAGLVGLSGSFFAARHDVCAKDWDTQSPSDFNTALQTAKAGMIAISCPDVHGIYKDIKDASKEYNRKVRTIIRGITALFRHTEVLNVRKFGLFAFQVISHKLLRWSVPWLLLIAAISNVYLLGQHWFFNLTFILQIVFYGLALTGWLNPRTRDLLPVRIIFFFVQVNLAIAEATVKYLTGTRMTVWKPSER